MKKSTTPSSKPTRSNVIISSSTDRRASLPSRSNHIQSIHAQSGIKPSSRTPSKLQPTSESTKRNPFTTATKSPMDVNTLLNKASPSPVRKSVAEGRKGDKSEPPDVVMKEPAVAANVKRSENARLSSSASPVTPSARPTSDGKAKVRTDRKENAVVGAPETKHVAVKTSSQKTKPRTTVIASTKVDSSSKRQSKVGPSKVSASVATTAASPTIAKPVPKPTIKPDSTAKSKPEPKSGRPTTPKTSSKATVETRPKSDKPKPTEVSVAKVSTPPFSTKDVDMKDATAREERRTRQAMKRKLVAASEVQAKRPKTEANGVSPSPVTGTVSAPRNPIPTSNDAKKTVVQRATGTPKDELTEKSAKRNTTPVAAEAQPPKATDTSSDVNAPKSPATAQRKESLPQKGPATPRKSALYCMSKKEEGLVKKLATLDSRSMAKTAAARKQSVASSSGTKDLVMLPPTSHNPLGVTSTKTKAFLPKSAITRSSLDGKIDVTKPVSSTSIARAKPEGGERMRPTPSNLRATVEKSSGEKADVAMIDSNDNAARRSGNVVMSFSSKAQARQEANQNGNMVGRRDIVNGRVDPTTSRPNGTARSSPAAHPKPVRSQSITRYPQSYRCSPQDKRSHRHLEKQRCVCW